MNFYLTARVRASLKKQRIRTAVGSFTVSKAGVIVCHHSFLHSGSVFCGHGSARIDNSHLARRQNGEVTVSKKNFVSQPGRRRAGVLGNALDDDGGDGSSESGYLEATVTTTVITNKEKQLCCMFSMHTQTL